MIIMDKNPEKHTNSIAVKMCLAAIFVLLAVIIFIPFIAGLQFQAAQRVGQRYLWQDAQGRFQVAMRIDPFDAALSAGYAGFLKDISTNRDDERPLLINSVKFYKRALELDPFNAEYALKLAEIEIELFIQGQQKDSSLLAEAWDYARIALKNDPHGFNISYSVGYAGISVWDKLDASGKELVLDRLRYILKAKPWYGEYVYSHLLYTVKNPGLVQKIRPTESDREAREKISRIKRIKQGSLSRSWQGKSKNGNNTYENGNMYWTGTMDILLNAPEGKVTVRIQAKGSPTDDVWPYMIVELDGKEIGETFVDNPEWKEYNFYAETSAGPKVLSVTFLNDGGNAQKNEDRNLYIGEAGIIKNE
jgi:tetratricopeptide (TPR) repeat protein